MLIIPFQLAFYQFLRYNPIQIIMTSPEMTQLREFETQSKFRIEFPFFPEALSYALDHNQQMNNDTFKPVLELGSLSAKSGLFSQITIQANTLQDAYMLRGGYDITVDLKYNDLNHQHWSKEQIEQLQKLLRHAYPDADVENMTNKFDHSLVIIGPIAQLLYVIDLGYENERAEWEHQVERDYRELSGEEALRRFMTARYPTPTPIDSHIAVIPLDKDPKAPYTQGLFTIPMVGRFISINEAIKEFTTTTKQWMWNVQDFVNVMAEAKGIPQSGRLILLPPSEIPQM